jgi:hypothetical protein
VTINPAVERDSQSFRATLLQLLIDSQNSDGGWGYHRVGESATEPTSWTLCALQDEENESGAAHTSISLGKDWLLRSQLHDGSWPAFASQKDGCWVTSLASLALHEVAVDSPAIARGLEWICKSWPRTPNFFQRMRTRFSPASVVTRQDNSLAGWSWTPDTGSWVEPTAYSLIFMHRLAPDRLSPIALRRMALAEAMLCDRMCPGGGWNSGNPLVYGVAGEPLVGPTVWALLALRSSGDLPQIRESLKWLETSIQDILGSGSVAIAHMCLGAFGRRAALAESELKSLFETDRFLNNIHVTALAALSLNPSRKMFPRAAGETSGK